MVDQDPRKSIRSLAKDLGDASTTIHRTVHDELWYSSYVLKPGHLMSHITKQKRLENAKKLLKGLKPPEEVKMLRFFSDKKNFDHE